MFPVQVYHWVREVKYWVKVCLGDVRMELEFDDPSREWISRKECFSISKE
jgi:hypothetical protein